MQKRVEFPRKFDAKIIGDSRCQVTKRTAGMKIAVLFNRISKAQKRNIFPAVIGGWSGWVASVVSGNKQQIIFAQHRNQLTQLLVKAVECLCVA